MPPASKQFFPFRPIGGGSLQITHDDIRAAMTELRQAGTATAAGKTYAVLDPQTGFTYSPKEVLERIFVRLGPESKYSFYGGKGWDGANRVFREFGFPVGDRKKLVEKWESLKSRTIPNSNVDELLTILFSQRWRLLPIGKELPGLVGQGPGVYVFAYSSPDLRGKIVREEDVFYVGMACEGLVAVRLRHFRDGIGHPKRLTLRAGVAPGVLHSAAARFRRVWLRGVPYDPETTPRLYFACVLLDSEPAKPWRTPDDLRNLGKVVELEYAAIARVKAVIGHEPLLNSK
jgi:hypothetical protein